MEKSKIRTVIGFFFIVTLLLGCNYGSLKKKMIAHKKVDVFETYEGDSLKIIFSLEPGDQCNVGQEKIGKMFGYLEVNCPAKGKGWVVIGDGYKIVEGTVGASD